MRVTTAEFIKHYGSLADRALSEPVTITKSGRDRLVVLSIEECERRRDRLVVKAAESPMRRSHSSPRLRFRPNTCTWIMS
jgi:hypothetical protein